MTRRFYLLKPEVAGHFGKRCIVDRSVHPPAVTKMHYEFDGWMGDDLLTTIGSFIVTLRLAGAIQAVEPRATGIVFDQMEVSKSGEWRQWEPVVPKEPPECVWLKINGIPSKDDFGQTTAGRLVVSDRILIILKSLNLNHCDITEYNSSPNQ